MTNGRLVPLPEEEPPLVAEDFDLLALYANSTQVARQVSFKLYTVLGSNDTLSYCKWHTVMLLPEYQAACPPS